MNINVLYLVEINPTDKLFFNSDLEKVFDTIRDEINLDNFDSIIIVNKINDFFAFLGTEPYIFNETPNLINNYLSHLTIYFTSKDTIASYLIIKDTLISNYIGKNEMSKCYLRMQVFKELIKISDNNSKISCGEFNLIFKSSTDFNSNIIKISNILWKEYISFKKGSKLMLYKDILNIDKLLKLINETKSSCDKLVSTHIDDLSICYNEIEQHTLNLLKYASKVIGLINGITFYYGKDLIACEQEKINHLLKKSYFKKIYSNLENELLLCEATNLYQINESNLDGIGKIVLNTLLELGLEYVIV